MIAIKSALIIQTDIVLYCLVLSWAIESNGAGPVFQATRHAIPPNCPVDVDSSVFLFHEVDAFAPAEFGRYRRVRRNQNTNKGDRSQDLEPHVALLCRSAQTSAQQFEFFPNEAWSKNDHQFVEKVARSLSLATITAETKGGVEQVTSSERLKLKSLRSSLLNEISGLRTFDERRD
jgi:hypothetical protein